MQTMNRMRVYVRATVLATVVPALVALLGLSWDLVSWYPSTKTFGETLMDFWEQLRDLPLGMLILACSYAGAHVVTLGLPAFLVLKRLGLVRWWTLAASGFVAGCIPQALLSWPQPGGGTEAALFLGAHGALGGLVAWLVIRKTEALAR